MSIEEVSAEKLAELFHHYHQVLGPEFGSPRRVSLESWEDLPRDEKNRIVAAARLALLQVAADSKHAEDSRRYFAKPGEAEWGS
jgi:hypothetical protein